MKKIIILPMLLILSATTFCQQSEPSPALTKQDYLTKSKKQKTAAWVLLAGGFALSTTSFLIATPKATEDYVSVFTGLFTAQPIQQNNYTGETILLVSGTVAMLSSIPLFIASGKNKRKAMSLTFKKETAPQIQNRSFVSRSVPSLSLKINL